MTNTGRSCRSVLQMQLAVGSMGSHEDVFVCRPVYSMSVYSIHKTDRGRRTGSGRSRLHVESAHSDITDQEVGGLGSMWNRPTLTSQTRKWAVSAPCGIGPL
uniref:SJCHGC07715 protein n=1 Tax=Schistosoma japonicum TaxID=6182 RepID=Q5DBR2_SCHJA|nr:SJCHGC07715 protein [Schistosoma japonicum]